MQITSLNLNNGKGLNFTSSEINSAKGKKRYKHYEQVSDDVLRMRSIINAHQTVEKSGKMRFFKAIPAITAGLIGASISLTQPEKLSTRVATGLGFLAIMNITGLVHDNIDKAINKKFSNKQEPNKTKKVLNALNFAGTLALTVGLFNIKKLGNIKALEPLTKLVSKEANQVAKEINSTKLGQFVENKINPFTSRHKDGSLTASLVAPLASVAVGTFATIKTADSLSKDIKTQAENNYAKAKLIQTMAKDHFDKIDAIEV